MIRCNYGWRGRGGGRGGEECEAFDYEYF